MSHYAIYVGSTRYYDAIKDLKVGRVADVVGTAVGDEFFSSFQVKGVWDGVEEHTAIYGVESHSDEVVTRLAYAIAIITGNDSVLVTRTATSHDDSAMRSKRKYRVRTEVSDTGNRTLLGPDVSEGFRFVPDIEGDTVAFLVNRFGAELSVVS